MNLFRKKLLICFSFQISVKEL